MKPGDSAAAGQPFQLMTIALEKKPGYIGREQLVTQMVSKLRTGYSWFGLMTPEVGGSRKVTACIVGNREEGFRQQ